MTTEKKKIEAFPNTDPQKLLITLEKHTTVYSDNNDRIPVQFGEKSQIKQKGHIELDLKTPWIMKEKHGLTESEAKRLVLDTLSHEVEHYNSSELDSKQKFIENWPQAPKLAGHVMNIVEDCYIDNKRLNKFEGLQNPQNIKRQEFINKAGLKIGKIDAEALISITAMVLLCDRRPETRNKFINEYSDRMEEIKKQVINADKQEDRLAIADKIVATILDNVDIPDRPDIPEFLDDIDFEDLERKAEDVKEEEDREKSYRKPETQEDIEEQREEEVEEKSVDIDADPEEEEEEEDGETKSSSENGSSSDSGDESEDNSEESSESDSDSQSNSEGNSDKNNDSNSDTGKDDSSDTQSNNEDGSNSEDSVKGKVKEHTENNDKFKQRNNSKNITGPEKIDTTKFVAKALNGKMGGKRSPSLKNKDILELDHESDLLSDNVKQVLEEMEEDQAQQMPINRESGSDLDVKKSVRYLSGDKTRRDIYKVNREDIPDKRCIGITIDASGSMKGKEMMQALKATTAIGKASDILGDDFTANTHWSDVGDDWFSNKKFWKDNGQDTNVTWITKIDESFSIEDLEKVKVHWREPISLGIKETRSQMQKTRKQGDKILFVIHDGNPTITEDGFPVEPDGISEEAVEDVREEVEKCRRLGIKVIGLAVGRDMEEWALNDMFGPDGWFKFDIEELPSKILNIYQNQAY